jgi:hypothetical protein
MFRIFLLLILLQTPTVAHAICASEDRIDMAQSGMSEEQIDAQCNSGQNYYSPPVDFRPAGQQASYCVTGYGNCLMSGPAPAGVGCACRSQFGPIPGISR